MRKPFKAAELVQLMKALLPKGETLALQPPTPGVTGRSDAGLIP